MNNLNTEFLSVFKYAMKYILASCHLKNTEETRMQQIIIWHN